MYVRESVRERKCVRVRERIIRKGEKKERASERYEKEENKKRERKGKIDGYTKT